MINLSPQEVINIEIKLLQSPGKTLTTLHKYHLMQKPDHQAIIFKKVDQKNLSPKLKKMFIGEVHALIDDPNANLRALSVIILKIIFTKQDKQQILWCLKSHLHQSQIDLNKFENIPKSGFHPDLTLLSKTQIKKILVEFLHLLNYSSEECKIQSQCKKYPLALQLLIFFWRTLLSKLNIPQVFNYQKKIPTQLCYRQLFDLLDIFYGKSQRLYFFQQENLFIQVGYDNQSQQFVDQIIIGQYYESQQQYLKSKIKNYESPLRFNTDNLKFSAQTFNPKYLKHEDIEKVNPFQLIIPIGSSIIMGKKDMKTSNSSLKSSNAFEKRHFNLPSNRSEHTVNLQDSQCDNPTPSFNHVTEDQVHEFFKPQDQSLQTIKNQCSTRGTNGKVYMKQSATIIPFKHKMLKSSLIKESNRKLKGSLQILPQKSFEFGGNEKNKCHTRIKTDKNEFNEILKTSPLFQQESCIKQNNQHLKEKRKMKRSQSQKNSIRQSQVTNGEDTNRVSLFDINCKKLKTSMQIDEFDFLSQKKALNHTAQNFNQKYFNQICGNSTYTCSCSSYKLQKNNLNSNIFAFKYEPQNLQNPDFKKKTQCKQIIKDNFVKKKTKLNDDFFKKLRIKRQQLKTSNSKNKSDPKHKSKQHQRQVKKPYFTKYSQFIKINQRNQSISKTPDKIEMTKTKTTFPSTLKNFKHLFDKSSIKNHNKNQNIGFYSIQNIQKRPNFNKTGSFREQQQRKLKYGQQNYSFQQNFYKMYSSPVTPNQNVINEQVEILLRNNTNTSLEDIVSPHKIVKGSRKTSFKIFEHKNNYDFGKNDNLFIHPSI